RVHLGRFVAPPVAQEPVELLDYGRVIAAVDEIGRRDRFLRMRVKEIDRAGVAIGDRRFGQGGRERRRQNGESPQKEGCGRAGRTGRSWDDIASQSSALSC